MGKKKVLITIDEDLFDRWDSVAKKIKMSKSGMVQEMLESAIPVFEKDGKSMFGYVLEKYGEGLLDVGSLFHEQNHSKD
jgi:metal-responsive CopG/Arc/MetJ family transcriptional regulator